MDINETWLKENGVDLPDKDLQKLADMAYDEWELRVGNMLAEKLTDEQIAEFEKITDEDGQVAWLDEVYPEYDEVVEREAEKLAAELKEAADKVKLIKSWAKF
jgi:hypothetical protein